MNIFQKKSRPKKLNLTEMWELHNLLGQWRGQKYLLDEIIELIQSLPPKNIKQSLNIMYDTVSIDNPLLVGLMFTKGLKYNYFFEFQEFVEKLNGRSKQ